MWPKKGKKRKSCRIFHYKSIYNHLEFQEGIWKITSEFCLWLKQGLQSSANVTQLLFLLSKKITFITFITAYHINHTTFITCFWKKGRFYLMHCNPGALYMLFLTYQMWYFSTLRLGTKWVHSHKLKNRNENFSNLVFKQQKLNKNEDKITLFTISFRNLSWSPFMSSFIRCIYKKTLNASPLLTSANTFSSKQWHP